MRSILVLIVLISLSFQGGAANHTHTALKAHDHPLSAVGMSVPEVLLQRDISRITGIGLVHESVSCVSKETQLFYDQGLTFLFHFDWISAARSFHRSLRNDSVCAMSFLGLSFAYSGWGDWNAAESALERATILGGSGNSRERLRIELRRKQLRAIASESQQDFEMYVQALDGAVQTFPKDPIFLLLRGNAAEGFAAAVGQRGEQPSIGFYRRVLELDPRNSAAQHYLAHCYEMVGDISVALEHAKQFALLSPSVPHAHHMYGHELRRAGFLNEAIRQFEIARRQQEHTYASEHETLAYDWHYRHNLNLLAAALRQRGNRELAENMLSVLNSLDSHTPGDDYYKTQLPEFLLQTGRLTRAMALAAAAAERSGVSCVLNRVIIGSAQEQLNDAQAAQSSLSAAEGCEKELSRAWKSILGPKIEILRAQLKLKTDRPAALSAFMEQEQRIRSLPGVDGWSDALFQLEFIGHLALNHEAWDLARFTVQQLSEHAPQYAGTRILSATVANHERKTKAE